jgi:hypothetical protein
MEALVEFDESIESRPDIARVREIAKLSTIPLIVIILVVLQKGDATKVPKDVCPTSRT